MTYYRGRDFGVASCGNNERWASARKKSSTPREKEEGDTNRSDQRNRQELSIGDLVDLFGFLIRRTNEEKNR